MERDIFGNEIDEDEQREFGRRADLVRQATERESAEMVQMCRLLAITYFLWQEGLLTDTEEEYFNQQCLEKGFHWKQAAENWLQIPKDHHDQKWLNRQDIMNMLTAAKQYELIKMYEFVVENGLYKKAKTVKVDVA